MRGNLGGITDGAISGNNRTNGYDSLGRITSASGPWGSGSYTYDALGNLRQKVLGYRSVNLSYDTSNRLTQSADTGPNGTRTMAYDARGNITTLGGLAFVYDFSDQPISISGTANGTYKYDGNLKRVKSDVNGETIYNVYDSSGALVHVHELDPINGDKRTDYVDGPSGTLARIENNLVTYLHPDYLGSAQSGTNSTGSVVWREQYTPFGEVLQGQAANDDQAGFTGHIKDSATGLNYMQARYYDPTIGRFLSVDTVGFTSENPMSFNRYLYVNNNPYKYTDPNGEFLNFAVKFVADVALNVAINYATTGEANLGGALTESALGAFNPASTLKKVQKLGNLVTDGSRLRRGANVCCFVAGTLVDTESGLRPIESIAVGDKVWSKDVETGEIALKPVTDLITRHERPIWVVELAGQDGTLSRFETTDDHPWWITRLGWVTTDQLAVGMKARTKDDQIATIVEVHRTGRTDATYNLTVADFETYFVGEQRVLVHNCPTGSYTNTHESGKKYFGKGDENRAATSGKDVAKENYDPLAKTETQSHATDRESFKQEARNLAADGGPKSDTNYNKIESPGKKMLDEDGN